MKLMIVTLMALATASQGFFFNGYPAARAGYPYAYNAVPYTAAAVAPAYTSSQYHAQDELGQASYGYAHPGQAHTNFQDAWGNQVGSYAYISPEGKEVRVNYVADRLGFRVASNALPVGPAAPVVAPLVGPAPVQDTPEVVAARAQHLAAVAEAKSGRVKRGLIATTSPFGVRAAAYPYTTPFAYPGYSPFAYAAPAYAAPAYTAAVPTAVVRDATLTKIVHNPNHAVSYRVD